MTNMRVTWIHRVKQTGVKRGVNVENLGCFTNVSRALQIILSKSVYCRNRTSYENFKLKLCTCAQNMALGTHTTFQFEILTINVISGIVYFRDIILDSAREKLVKQPLGCLLSERVNTITSNGSWCMCIKGEMSRSVCVTLIWYSSRSLVLHSEAIRDVEQTRYSWKAI